MLLDGQPWSAALIIGGFGLGIAFLKAEFSYTASWRRFLTRGEAGGLIGGLIVIAICALAVVPVAALRQNFGGAIAPLGPSLIIGAFVFGIGMQLANGCGSGTLYTVGGGSGRMLVTLLLFFVGSVLGSLSLPAAMALGGVDPILASDYLGPWGGRQRRSPHRIGGWADRCGRKAARRQFHAVAQLCDRRTRHRACCVCSSFAAGGHPWSVTFGFTVWGAKAATALGFDLSHPHFGNGRGPNTRLPIRIVGHIQSDQFRDVVRCHGGGGSQQTIRRNRGRL